MWLDDGPDPDPPPVDDDFDPKEMPGEWARHAACIGKPTEWFFTERGESVAIAKAVCASCPVQQQCLEHAVRVREKFGIWGGSSERQRRRMRKHARSVDRERGDAA